MSGKRIKLISHDDLFREKVVEAIFDEKKQKRRITPVLKAKLQEFDLNQIPTELINRISFFKKFENQYLLFYLLERLRVDSIVLIWKEYFPDWTNRPEYENVKLKIESIVQKFIGKPMKNPKKRGKNDFFFSDQDLRDFMASSRLLLCYNKLSLSYGIQQAIFRFTNFTDKEWFLTIGLVNSHFYKFVMNNITNFTITFRKMHRIRDYVIQKANNLYFYDYSPIAFCQNVRGVGSISRKDYDFVLRKISEKPRFRLLSFKNAEESFYRAIPALTKFRFKCDFLNLPTLSAIAKNTRLFDRISKFNLGGFPILKLLSTPYYFTGLNDLKVLDELLFCKTFFFDQLSTSIQTNIRRVSIPLNETNVPEFATSLKTNHFQKFKNLENLQICKLFTTQNEQTKNTLIGILNSLGRKIPDFKKLKSVEINFADLSVDLFRILVSHQSIKNIKVIHERSPTIGQASNEKINMQVIGFVEKFLAVMCEFFLFHFEKLEFVYKVQPKILQTTSPYSFFLADIGTEKKFVVRRFQRMVRVSGYGLGEGIWVCGGYLDLKKRLEMLGYRFIEVILGRQLI